MIKTWQWRPVLAFRTVLIASVLVFVCIVANLNASPLDAASQNPTGLSFEWVGGEPPRYLCVGDSFEQLWAIYFAPDPDLAALAPLVPSGQPSPVPPAPGGALDVKATKGSVAPSHWTLDFRTANAKAASFTYTATAPGIIELTVSYDYYDGTASYRGSEPPVRIRVQPCDYRINVSLTDSRTISGIGGIGDIHLTGDGGIKLKYDEKNGRGHTPFSGNGATTVDYVAQFSQASCSAFTSGPGTGKGTMAITGEVLDDGTLEMSLIVFDVPVTFTAVGVCPEGSGSKALSATYSITAKCFDSMRFPAEGGTQPCSEPGPSPHPSVTSTIAGQIKVSWEDVK